MLYGVMIVGCLATEAVQGATLALKCVHDIKRGDSLALVTVSIPQILGEAFCEPLRVQCTGNVSMFAWVEDSSGTYCDSISDDALKEGLQDTSGLLIDHGGDTLDTTTAGKTSDSWLSDTLDVVSQDLAVTLRTALSQTLAAFPAYWGEVSTMSCREG